MELTITPRTGVGPLRLGITRSEVRRLITTPCIESMAKSSSTIPVDAFYDACLQVFYDNAEKCEAVELYPPLRVFCAGVSVFETSYNELRQRICNLDPDVMEDVDGITSVKCGLSAYAPSHSDSPHLPAESIIVFKEGYYSQTQ